MIRPTIIMGSRLAIAPIHSMRPSVNAGIPDVRRCFGDEGFDAADSFDRQLRNQRLAVHGVGGVIGSGERLRRAAELTHREGAHRAVGVTHHGRRQVRGEVIAPCHRFVDGVPSGDGIEVRVTDPVNPPFCVHALVQRVGVLDVLIVKQCDAQGTVLTRHQSTVMVSAVGVNQSRRS